MAGNDDPRTEVPEKNESVELDDAQLDDVNGGYIPQKQDGSPRGRRFGNDPIIGEGPGDGSGP